MVFLSPLGVAFWDRPAVIVVSTAVMVALPPAPWTFTALDKWDEFATAVLAFYYVLWVMLPLFVWAPLSRQGGGFAHWPEPRNGRDIARLITAPLLCAMLCHAIGVPLALLLHADQAMRAHVRFSLGAIAVAATLILAGVIWAAVWLLRWLFTVPSPLLPLPSPLKRVAAKSAARTPLAT